MKTVVKRMRAKAAHARCKKVRQAWEPLCFLKHAGGCRANPASLRAPMSLRIGAWQSGGGRVPALSKSGMSNTFFVYIMTNPWKTVSTRG